MPRFYSPSGNPEMWKEKPIGYYTEEEWAALHPVPEYVPTKEEMFMWIRRDRNIILSNTDYFYTDVPISEENKAELSAYRQALRDLPQQEGAPWDGGGDETPWPKAPDFIKQDIFPQ